MRTVTVEQFEGPLTLLLELIEGAKLDISEISLAAVTEQYLAALQSAEGLPTDELADFLVVAARLLLLKSKTLLPGIAVEGDDAVSLEQQLRLYKQFVDASRVIRKQLAANRPVFVREHPLVSGPVFLPPQRVSAGVLAATFRQFLQTIEPPLAAAPDMVRRTVSLQEKIRRIHELIASREGFGFTKLISEAGSRTEIIVTFLAILELVKQRTVVVAQGELFEDISVTLHPEYVANV